MHKLLYTYWLEKIQNDSVKFLAGLNLQKALSMAETYDVLPGQMTFGAEIPLIGEPYIDLSAVYPVDLFYAQNIFAGTGAENIGTLFRKYTRFLVDRRNDISVLCFIVEGETDEDNVTRFSYFLPGGDERLYHDAVDFLEQEYHMMKASVRLHNEQWFENTKRIGFMSSRDVQVIRLSMPTEGGDVAKLIYQAEHNIGYKLPSNIVNGIVGMQNNNIANCVYDLDIYDNGDIGDTLGLELNFDCDSIENQYRDLQSPVTKNFFAVLGKYGVVDDRIDDLLNASWKIVAIYDGQKYGVISSISHIKLKWKHGVMLPAKVYVWFHVEKLSD